MGIKDVLNKFRGRGQLDDPSNNDVITSLAKIKKQLSELNDIEITEYKFMLDDINPDLKALKTITNNLNKNGFDCNLTTPEEDIDSYLNTIYCVDLTIKQKSINNIEFKKNLDLVLDNHFIKLGVSLDILNYEIAKNIPCYQNIINNNIETKELISNQFDRSKKLKI